MTDVWGRQTFEVAKSKTEVDSAFWSVGSNRGTGVCVRSLTFYRLTKGLFEVSKSSFLLTQNIHLKKNG